MISDVEHLVLTENVLRSTVEHLSARLSQRDPLFDFDEEEREYSEEQKQVLRLERCIYRLCLDAVREQRLCAEGQTDPLHQQRREQFLRLMASAAMCEVRRDQHILSIGLAAPSPRQVPRTEGQMFDDIRERADTTLRELVGV